jgi:hypothetical protein
LKTATLKTATLKTATLKTATLKTATLKTATIFTIKGAMLFIPVLAASITPVAGIGSSSNVIINTSADDQNSTFFGQGAIQVLITDPNARSGGGTSQSTIPVTVIAEAQHSKRVAANTFDIPETVLGAGKFEFYLSHQSSATANGAGIHPINTFGLGHLTTQQNQTFQLANPSLGKLAPVITFGVGGDLDTGTSLFETALFKVIYGDQQISFFYEETPAKLMIDRDTYGSDNSVHVFIADQDANANPTVPDRFIVNQGNIKNIFSLLNGTFNLKNDITFTETGPNTGRFEGTFDLGDTMLATAKSLVLILHDKVNYNNVNAAENDNHNDFSKVIFNIKNTDAKLTFPYPLSPGSGLILNLNDPDENKDSEIVDTIGKRLTVAIEGGGDSETVDMRETQANSGMFGIDNSYNALQTSFETGPTKKDNGVLEFTPNTVHNNVKVIYSDPFNTNDKPAIFVSSIKIHTNTTASVPLNHRP